MKKLSTLKEAFARQRKPKAAPLDQAALERTFFSHVLQRDVEKTTAFIKEHPAAVYWLHQKASDPTDTARTALHIAVVCGALPLASALLKSGADVNARNGKNQTPLMTAANTSDKNMIELLLKKGAKTELADDDGSTALMLAAQARFTGAITALLAGGAQIEAQDADKCRALHYAVLVDKSGPLRALLAAGADTTAQDINGETPAATARRVGKDAQALIIDNHIIKVAEERVQRAEQLQQELDEGFRTKGTEQPLSIRKPLTLRKSAAPN